MAYATTAQIQIAAGGADRYVQLFDWDADGVADVGVLAQLQLEVDSWIDSYVGRRFAVPLAAPTSVLTLLSAEEVVYRARTKRGMVHDDDHKQREQREKWLDGCAKGRVVPSEPQPAKATSARGTWVERDTDDVSRTNLKGLW